MDERSLEQPDPGRQAHHDLETPLDRLGASRRRFLAMAGATVGTGALAACAGGGGGDDKGGDVTDGGGEKSDKNPFAVKEDAPVDVVIFDGGYGDSYAKDAGEAYKKMHSGAEVKVSSTVEIQSELQPRFIDGTPPDLFDNSGAQHIDSSALISEKKLASLEALLKAPSIDGGTIEDSLLPGATEPGTYSGKLYALNYVYTVFGLWHSQKEFDEKGWAVSKTWDELMALGEQAKGAGQALFAWGGQNAADYFQEMALSMAIKQGGKEVQQKIDKLEKDAFAQQPVVDAYTAIEDAVKAGFFLGGGAGIKHTEAQTQWVNGKAVLYPCGSWIENEQRDVTPEGYAMTGAPVPLLSGDAAMPFEAIHGAAGEPFQVPAQAKNGAGGLEFLRVMLSKEQCQNFSKITSSPTIVKDTLPEDAFGSTALASVNTMISDAGENVYTYNFTEWYGLGTDLKPLWTSFLNGDKTAQQVLEETQGLVDKVREDPNVEKFDVK